jgi:Zn-dependent peptidase ImmA (M78 family)
VTIRRKHIRELVFKLLRENDVLRPPVPVERIAKACGALVRKEGVDDDVSGFLYRNPQSKLAVIGANRLQHPNRQRFTVAHELGHLLLHSGDDVHVDKGFSVKKRDERSAKGVDVEEMEANLFAAELLMPLNFLDHDLKQVGALDLQDEEKVSQLAQVYRVSNQAMAVRLTNLGYLSIDYKATRG